MNPLRKSHRMNFVQIIASVCAVFGMLLSTIAHAEDWPEWMGKGRLGVWNEDGILEKFPEGGLTVTWRKPIGMGYSGPAVSQGLVVTMDYKPKEGSTLQEAVERVVCFDEKTGEQVWADTWETHYREIMQSYHTGPRATPTIDGDRVYAIGAAGNIRALELKTGKLLWSKDCRTEYKTMIPIFGMSSSAIIDGPRVIIVTGGDREEGDGQIRAFDKKTGKEIWRALPTNYELGYSQPIIYQIAGVPQLIFWDIKGLHSLNPETGVCYWSVPMETKNVMAIATPVKSGNKILVSSFYSGSMLVEVDETKPGAKKVWAVQGKAEFPDKTEGLHAVITTPVIEGDYFYGTCSYGMFRGLKLANSERVWANDKLTRQGRWGSAFLVKHGDRYFMNNDIGELLIVKFTPEGPIEIDRTKLIEPDTNSGFGPRRMFESTVNWVHPAYANRHIIIRNDHEILRASLEKK
jgi:outer membrane protein assembly factor BamB